MNTLTRTTRYLCRTPLGMSALVAIFVAGGINMIARPSTKAAHAQAKPPAPTITLSTKPTPPAVGATMFTVTVKAADGKPVVGADVAIELVMPAMPSMNMAEMRSKVALKPADDVKLAAAGTYTGTGQIMMAGKWNATVSVRVKGKDFAEHKVTLTAK